MSPAVRRAILVLLLVVSASVGMLGVRWLRAATADPRPSVMGIRLGMTADDIRARVDADGPGAWTTELVSGDWRLEHRHGTDVARFEIHEGQLVAIRLDAEQRPDLASEPEYEVTPGSILVRVVEGDRVRITLLSRDCPTHHIEAEHLVAAHVAAP